MAAPGSARSPLLGSRPMAGDTISFARGAPSADILPHEQVREAAARALAARLGNGALLRRRDRPSRALPVGRGAARGSRPRAGDDRQRLARGGGDAVRAPARARRPGRRRAADLRPHAAAPAAARRRAGAGLAGGRRARRRRSSKRRSPRGRSSSPTSSPTPTTPPAARSRRRSAGAWSSSPPSTTSGSSRTTPTASCPSRASRWRRCSRWTRPAESSTPPPSRRRSAPASASATWPARRRRSRSWPKRPTRPTSRRTCWPSRSSSSSAARGELDRNIEFVKGELKARCDALVAALREQIPEAEFVVPDGGYFLWLDLAEGTDTRRPAGRGERRRRLLRRRPRLHDRGRREQPPPLLRPGPGRPRRRGRVADRRGARALALPSAPAGRRVTPGTARHGST